MLTERALNRALLARQLLLERVGLPIPRALERIGGIQNQYAPSGYVGLWTRLEGFERDALTRALERRTVVQGTLMRATIHLVSARDYWPLALGVRRARREWAVRVQKADPVELTRRARAGDFAGAAMLWTDVVRVPPSGTWERRRADKYALADEWLGRPDATEESGLDHLLRRYLGGFGPAPLADAASWAGVPPAFLKPSVGRLRLRRFRDEAGGELLDLPRTPLPDPDTPAPVRFLPHWDACLLVHARRTGVLTEEHRVRMFHTKNPFSVGAVLVDGRVAGAWSVRERRIVVEPYERLPRRHVEEERQRLEAFHA
ncbi:MAG: AlkZ family DNA glycosylase [Thermoleophilia bacterium]|nr:AlkZ family DNA glycosylase [Thermoleophilia bacterium]